MLVPLRLQHIFHDAIRVWLLGCLHPRSGPAKQKSISDWLVRRKSSDADTDHPHHPDKQDSLSAEPSVVAFGSDVRNRSGDWTMVAVFYAWSLPRLYTTAVAVLALARSHRSWIRTLDPFRENLAAAKKLDLTRSIAARFSFEDVFDKLFLRIVPPLEVTCCDSIRRVW